MMTIVPALLKFMKKRYSISFTGSDFKDEKEILDYILEKETSNPSLRSAIQPGVEG